MKILCRCRSEWPCSCTVRLFRPKGRRRAGRVQHRALHVPLKLELVSRKTSSAGRWGFFSCRDSFFQHSLSLSLSAVASRGSSSARQRVRLKPLRPLTKRKQQAALQAAGNADICQAHTSAFTFAAHSQLKHETSTTTPASRTSSKLSNS